MTLSDKMAYRQIIGCLMLNPLLFLEYPDMNPSDFDEQVARICFVIIQNLYEEGAQKLTPIEVDQEVEKHDNSYNIYRRENGLEFLKTSYEFAELSNFKVYYTRLKKYSLLRRLKKDKYDISEFYIEDKDIDDPLVAVAIQERFDESSLEEILNAVESKYSIIRNEYLNGGRAKGDPAEGITGLIEELKKAPSIGPSLEGKIFSSACRGAREGCFYLKSASTSAGKSRTFIFDACHLAYPERWSSQQKTFVCEYDSENQPRLPQKVLFIVTEMDREELQTIMLAYLSGVDEDHILTGRYEFNECGNEEDRVKYAAKIIEKYSGYFIIEEISSPNLTNIEATIKKYAIIDNVKYVFFDYIHSTSSMFEQFQRNNVAEHTILMMMSNQLKQIAKNYKLFIFSGTQVNEKGMTSDDGEFKDETCIRGSKAVADKVDMGYVMSRISEKFWNSVLPRLQQAVRNGTLDEKYVREKRPTHILDIYKMRRGRYKNVRIWTYLHLGTGEREDLFMTTADNQPIRENIDLFLSAREEPISEWKGALISD